MSVRDASRRFGIPAYRLVWVMFYTEKIKDAHQNWNFIKTVQMEIFLKNYFQRDYLTKSPIYRTIMYEKRGDYYDREDGIYGAAGGGNVANI